MLFSELIKYSTTWSVTSVAAADANLNVMFLLWLKLSATHILLPQQPNLNVIERKFKRQILKPDPIILDVTCNSCKISFPEDQCHQNFYYVIQLRPDFKKFSKIFREFPKRILFYLYLNLTYMSKIVKHDKGVWLTDLIEKEPSLSKGPFVSGWRSVTNGFTNWQRVWSPSAGAGH